MEFVNFGLQPWSEIFFLAKPNKIPMAFRGVVIPQQIRQIASNMTTEVHICMTYKKRREIPVVIVNLDFQEPLLSLSWKA